ncbi:MAG TPA: ATP-binding cassette domain-containing protein [Anaerolineae bacterium]|nr:ATP-binding cassette domain-containing protein [Anaerolineae bacterium]
MFNLNLGKSKNGNGNGSEYLIEVRDVVKTFKTAAGPFTALKNVSLRVNRGEFVAVIGKSGSGKSTLLNMITGIDHPTAGEVYIDHTMVHDMGESKLARWRGKNLGIVFQFFQLLPTLTLAENIMLPMDFCGVYSPGGRKRRAAELLDMVGLGDQAHKLPSAVSGGQQQRAAIARALANDPPILVADEPTGNLDSKTAEDIFTLFETLASQGKTIVMVTHDADKAKRVQRAVVVSDGEIIEEYLARTFSSLTTDQLIRATRKIAPARYEPGTIILQEGATADNFYLVTRGSAEVVLKGSDGSDIIVSTLHSGQYFGEIALLRGAERNATVRAGHSGVEVMALDKETFDSLLNESESTRDAIDEVADRRELEIEAIERKNGHH